jgi:hypothetical protein
MSDAKMMAEGKIIDVAVKKTSHSIHLPKQKHKILSGPDQYNVFSRILFEFVFCLRYTITKSDRLACIEYNITNSSWLFGPNGSLWTGLSPTK